MGTAQQYGDSDAWTRRMLASVGKVQITGQPEGANRPDKRGSAIGRWPSSRPRPPARPAAPAEQHPAAERPCSACGGPLPDDALVPYCSTLCAETVPRTAPRPHKPAPPPTLAEEPPMPPPTAPAWPAERILDAIRNHAAEHGHAPSAGEWQGKDPAGARPSTGDAIRTFGAWSKAIAEAGVPPKPHPRHVRHNPHPEVEGHPVPVVEGDPQPLVEPPEDSGSGETLAGETAGPRFPAARTDSPHTEPRGGVGGLIDDYLAKPTPPPGRAPDGTCQTCGALLHEAHAADCAFQIARGQVRPTHDHAMSMGTAPPLPGDPWTIYVDANDGLRQRRRYLDLLLDRLAHRTPYDTVHDVCDRIERQLALLAEEVA